MGSLSMNFIVLDFEATCDEPVNRDPQEIVEFPALLVEGDTRQLVSEFHTYVRPVAHPVLTSFCTQLTGIRQSQVERCPPFPVVLEQFGHWLDANASSEFLLVTCGDWDLGSLLPRQCEQHGIGVPSWAARWANLKRAFLWNYPQASHQTSLDAMAKALGLPWIGRAHSGIDDSRNIARILQKMLAAGICIENTAFWRCLNCGQSNAYRARHCFGCQTSAFELRPGDWPCPHCGFGNYADRTTCFDCGRPRVAPAKAPPVVGSSWKTGDWSCGNCGAHNFAKRTTCFRCAQPRLNISG